MCCQDTHSILSLGLLAFLTGCAGSSTETPPPPPLAMAPFDAQEALGHQESWAEHLGQPVEITNSIGLKLRLIPPGEFMMGSPETEADRSSQEGPQHRVRITRPFYLGVYEVTRSEYERVMGSSPTSSLSRSGRASERISGLDASRWPVESVSWEDAVEFCRRLSALSEERSAGRVYRLPTEAEWEYACGANTTTTPLHFGPKTVGSLRSNGFGLRDMHGNVWEWVSDWSENYYAESPSEDPAGPPSGSRRVLRGGSADDSPGDSRLEVRLWSFGVGFRVALVPADVSVR